MLYYRIWGLAKADSGVDSGSNDLSCLRHCRGFGS